MDTPQEPPSSSPASAPAETASSPLAPTPATTAGPRPTLLTAEIPVASSSTSSPITPIPRPTLLTAEIPVASSSTSSPITPIQPGVFVPTPRPLVPTQPGKSILKKPPPPPRSFFSSLTTNLPGGLSRFIPTSAPNNSSSASSNVNSAATKPAARSIPGGDHGGVPGSPPPLRPSDADGPSLASALLPSAIPEDFEASSKPQSSPDHPNPNPKSPPERPSTPSGLSKLSNTPANRSLRRAHFILPQVSTIYPISSAAPPSSSELTAARAEIDARVSAQRRKEKEEGPGAWSIGRIEDFYRECCRLREEPVLSGVVGALRTTWAWLLLLCQANIIAPRTLDLTSVKLSIHAAAALADALAIEWGLRKLILKDCDLEDAALKPILHALLIPSSLASLSLSSNRRLKQPAFKLVMAYLSASDTLEFIDLSHNALEKKSVEIIAQAIQAAPPAEGRADSSDVYGFSYPGSPLASPIYTSISSPSTYFPPLMSDLVGRSRASSVADLSLTATGEKVTVPLLSLRLDDCGLKGGALEALVQNISLRNNKMGPLGAVALALMIRDYPDTVPLVQTPSPGFSNSPSFGTTSFNLHSPPQPSSFSGGSASPGPIGRTRAPSTTASSIRSSLSALGNSIANGRPGSSSATANGTHNANPQAPRTGIEARLASASGRSTPTPSTPPAQSLRLSSQKPGVLDSHSAALLDNIRSFDHLPRLGNLTTLDLRGNDLRNGVQFIAQVLKRNRTLKVLSLADNRIEVPGFVQIAEALKYNSTLETLDMSQNPCCGPSLEGVTAIRTAFTINTALKRLYLSSTGLTSSGTIALAEFLPDAPNLLHLDLTQNPRLDLAAVLALNAGLKVNKVIRCLDVNVPPNDPEMARLSREILRSCVRNTEMVAQTPSGSKLHSPITESEKGASSLSMSEDLDLLFGGGSRGGVWGLIERSELARGVRQDVERERVGQERLAMKEPDGKFKLELWNKPPEEVVRIARELLKEAQGSPNAVDSELLLSKSQLLVTSVGEMIQTEKDPSQLEELLELSDRLNGLIKDLVRVPPLPSTRSSPLPVSPAPAPSTPTTLQSSSDNEQPSYDSLAPLPSDQKSGRAPYGAERAGSVRRNSKGKEKAPESVNLDIPVAFSNPTLPDIDEEATPPHSAAPSDIVSSSPEAGGSSSGSGSGLLSEQVIYEEPLSAPSTSLNRSWIEEEGEVFRKGTVLLGPEGLGEEGADLNSEELKREILEAQVERRPRHEELEEPGQAP
ncbi:hypothetical protein DL93DRAFT_2220611 [Clavulina sp. PMI_390]|nr:hypothetical protein DL93DRAFT_2220611 [Clavulina sp. PMI_390]